MILTPDDNESLGFSTMTSILRKTLPDARLISHRFPRLPIPLISRSIATLSSELSANDKHLITSEQEQEQEQEQDKNNKANTWTKDFRREA